jgi:hypothetical protein
MNSGFYSMKTRITKHQFHQDTIQFFAVNVIQRFAFKEMIIEAFVNKMLNIFIIAYFE